MAKGTLGLRLVTGSALPVTGAVVRIKTSAGPLIFEERVPLGSDGLTPFFELEVPDLDTTFDPDELLAPYGLYNVEVIAPGYQNTYINGVQVFADSEAILEVQMQPLPEAFPPSQGPVYLTLPPHALRLPPQPPADLSTLAPQRPVGQLHTTPYIPEYITVHLGVPNDTLARNVTVTFQDYIKNVASSEIYPTWPEESLRANILAQISLVLNRVYTEWYRSRGYDFDITNSTQYDQYFVEGRNYFENISRIVDEIFNVYLRKPGREEPFYAEYCNGTTVTCPGMSQWGTVGLANQGLSALEILENYYGELETVEDNVLIGGFESYPGTPLSLGAQGEPVREMQQQLNRIAVNYPRIPLVAVDGIFGLSKRNAVEEFQRIFNLSPDGVVGKATWYAISRIYVAVKRLAELTSEGERPSYSSQEYPGTVLRVGSQGSEVLEIQLYLSTIALYNDMVRDVEIDGVYGGSTRDSVYSFQLAYGLTPDGRVGPVTWYKLVDVYNGIRENVNVPSVGDSLGTLPYPSYELSVGDNGESVLYIQKLINALSRVFVDIPSVEEDGIFGSGTENAVRTFQRLVGIDETGIVDSVTWNLLNDVYRKEANNQIDDLGERAYPNTLLREGSRGENVRYVIASLNAVGRRLEGLPRLAVGDRFTSEVADAVRIFQRLVGLTADGVVGRDTWTALNAMVSYVNGGCHTPLEPVSSLSRGSRGLAVLLLQLELLKVRGFLETLPANLTPDGVFGGITQTAVGEFQRGVGISPTGVATVETRSELARIYRRICNATSEEERDNIMNELTRAVAAQVRAEPSETLPQRPQIQQRTYIPSVQQRPQRAVPPFERPLRAGVVGADVMRLKTRLAELGLLDGSALDNNVFGTATRRALERFQAQNGLERTGRLDRMTHEKIYS